MKNFISKVKKAVSATIIAIVFLPSKIFAVNPMVQLDYGVIDPKSVQVSAHNILYKLLIIPIASIVGIIVYLKKSKSSKKTKLFVTLGIIALTIILYFVIKNLIMEWS